MKALAFLPVSALGFIPGKHPMVYTFAALSLYIAALLYFALLPPITLVWLGITLLLFIGSRKPNRARYWALTAALLLILAAGLNLLSGTGKTQLLPAQILGMASRLFTWKISFFSGLTGLIIGLFF